MDVFLQLQALVDVIVVDLTGIESITYVLTKNHEVTSRDRFLLTYTITSHSPR